jgi:uncharacterized membrane protein
VKLSPLSRLLALDWLRGAAVLVMVECHVFNAVIAPRYREAGWFVFLNWLNGFVAPAFLMVSGGVIGINLQKRWEDVLTFGKAWSRLWRRIGQIFIVAYLLHLPTPSGNSSDHAARISSRCGRRWTSCSAWRDHSR